MTSQHEFSTTPLQPAEPAAGYEVFTDDGLPVGAVSEVAGGFMRIDAPLRPDFWLRTDDAANVEGRAITLAYPGEALAQHKHAGPAISSDDFVPAGADPVLLDEDERQHQRELMEREIEEQRRRRDQGAMDTPVEDDWQHEQEAGAKIIGVVTAAVAALAGVTAIVLVRRMLRRRRLTTEHPERAGNLT